MYGALSISVHAVAHSEFQVSLRPHGMELNGVVVVQSDQWRRTVLNRTSKMGPYFELGFNSRGTDGGLLIFLTG